MDKTLIIYDNTGRIVSSATGTADSYYKPVGLPYLEIEIPLGKRVKEGTSVDVTVTPHQVILEDIPPSEIETMRADLDTAILELSLMIGGM